MNVEWEGLPDVTDRIWEPLEHIKDDLPGMLHKLLLESGKPGLNKKAVAL